MCPEKALITIVTGTLLLALVGCSEGAEKQPTLELLPLSFVEGEVLPRRHTCTGEGASPAIYFSTDQRLDGVGIIFESENGEGDVVIHWVAVTTNENGYLPGNLPRTAMPVPGIMQGNADDGLAGYQAPCPEKGDELTYRFHAYGFPHGKVPTRSQLSNMDARDLFEKQSVVRSVLTVYSQ